MVDSTTVSVNVGEGVCEREKEMTHPENVSCESHVSVWVPQFEKKRPIRKLQIFDMVRDLPRRNVPLSMACSTTISKTFEVDHTFHCGSNAYAYAWVQNCGCEKIHLHSLHQLLLSGLLPEFLALRTEIAVPRKKALTLSHT